MQCRGKVASDFFYSWWHKVRFLFLNDTLWPPIFILRVFVWGGLGMGCLQAPWFRWHKKCALCLTGHICYDCHFSRWIEIFFHKEQVSYVTGLHPILKGFSFFFSAAFWTSKSILLWGVQAFAVTIQGFWEQFFLFSEKPLIVIIVFLWGPVINLQIVKCLKLAREGYFEHHLTFFCQE